MRILEAVSELAAWSVMLRVGLFRRVGRLAWFREIPLLAAWLVILFADYMSSSWSSGAILGYDEVGGLVGEMG